MALNTSIIPQMFASVFTGAPEPVFFSMWADDTSFTDAMDTFVEGQIPGDDILDAVDEDETGIDPETDGYSFFDPWDDDFYFDVLDEEGGEEADALTSVGMDMLDYLLEAEEVIPTDLGAPIPGVPPIDLGMPVDITAGLPPTDLGGQPYVPETDLGLFDPETIYLEGGPMVDLLGFGGVGVDTGEGAGETDENQVNLFNQVFDPWFEESVDEVIAKIRQGMSENSFLWSEVVGWLNADDWGSRAKKAGVSDPDVFKDKILNTFSIPKYIQKDVYEAEGDKGAWFTETGSSITDTAAATGEGLVQPSYIQRFSQVFDAMPGSQTITMQNLKEDVFNEAEVLYYALQDWGEHDWMWKDFEVSMKNPMAFQQDPEEGSDKSKEENAFTKWLTDSYIKNTQETRFGSEFYDSVRRLRSEMLEIQDESQEDHWRRITREEDGAGTKEKRKYMNNIIFMSPNQESYGRLAKVVGMYNITPNADNWLKGQMMKHYAQVLNGWILSGRTPHEFIETFVKDKPMMAGTAWEGPLPEEGPFTD